LSRKHWRLAEINGNRKNQNYFKLDGCQDYCQAVGKASSSNRKAFWKVLLSISCIRRFVTPVAAKVSRACRSSLLRVCIKAAKCTVGVDVLSLAAAASPAGKNWLASCQV
jgi:hypothetical protein